MNTLRSVVTAQPYNQLMDIVDASAQGDVAAFDFAQLGSPAIWRNMLITRDVLPFVPTQSD